ncbi:MAG: nucleotidyltransferase family protein [Nitrosotalea sp.]
MSTTLEEIKIKAVPILKKAGVTRSAIFGSYVRDEQTEKSDIDILVEYPKGKSLFDFVGTQLELEDALGKKVDLVEYKMIKPRLKPYILSKVLPIL